MGPLQDIAALFFLALLGLGAAWLWVTGQLQAEAV
jgi:hypothetical protein